MSESPYEELLRADGASPLLIRQFEYAMQQYQAADAGCMEEADMGPVHSLPSLDSLDEFADAGRQAMSKVAVIKLNGGLGTSMGLDRAKSLLPVKQGVGFLDIIVRQVLSIREQYDTQTPLLLMNSFATREDSLAVLAKTPALAAGQPELPLDFVQNRIPRIRADTGEPATHARQPDLAWCPPGHGDLFICLQTSGLLDLLMVRGFRYAFVSNADNLGATLDPLILGFLAKSNFPFLMEATRRTAADRKGGHLAISADGHYLLRESAQCRERDRAAFQDIQRYRYFNTNSLWMDLLQLHSYLQDVQGIIPLPVMVNRKTLDPRDPASPAVVQLETAMGAALSVIPGAVAIDVPRTRFAPVKTTDDLLVLRSDVFDLDDQGQIKPNPARLLPTIRVQLDPRYYRLLPDFEARFARGVPSLVGCQSFRITGDVRFGANVVCRGNVEIINEAESAATLPDGTVLTDTVRLNAPAGHTRL